MMSETVRQVMDLHSNCQDIRSPFYLRYMLIRHRQRSIGFRTRISGKLPNQNSKTVICPFSIVNLVIESLLTSGEDWTREYFCKCVRQKQNFSCVNTLNIFTVVIFTLSQCANTVKQKFNIGREWFTTNRKIDLVVRINTK